MAARCIRSLFLAVAEGRRILQDAGRLASARALEETARRLGRGSRQAWGRLESGLGERYGIAHRAESVLEGSYRNWRLAISSIKDNAKLCQSLLQLCAAADQACAGVGSTYSLEGSLDEQFHFQAEDLLTPKQNGSSLCREVHPTRARVLPKMHTPWSGLTIRSLSLYLSLCSADEVSPQWITLGSYPERETCSWCPGRSELRHLSLILPRP
jgi:hypothetical protein